MDKVIRKPVPPSRIQNNQSEFFAQPNSNSDYMTRRGEPSRYNSTQRASPLNHVDLLRSDQTLHFRSSVSKCILIGERTCAVLSGLRLKTSLIFLFIVSSIYEKSASALSKKLNSNIPAMGIIRHSIRSRRTRHSLLFLKRRITCAARQYTFTYNSVSKTIIQVHNSSTLI